MVGKLKKTSLEPLHREKILLSEEINRVEKEMENTLINFSHSTDPELVDFYTYQYKAKQMKHTYLIRKLKEIYYDNK